MHVLNTKPGDVDGHDARFSNIDDWLQWQEGLHFSAIELGLDRCREVASRMQLLEPDFRVICISGTNGKGSSAAMLDRILRTSGLRIGTYTSPHLVSYNERICVNGRQIDDASLCRSFDRIDRSRGDITLTYFEFGTLAALDIFSTAALDIAIMEVGLGGRLDAVNILDSDIALVTTIDFDHENWLGYDRESIGREKAGIFRGDGYAVCSELDPPLSIEDRARELGTRLFRSGIDYTFSISDDTWSWHHDDIHHTGLPVPGMNNEIQVQNAAGVLMVLTLLDGQFTFDAATVHESLAEFRLPGRFQGIPGENPCILDVAHNPQAAAALVDNIRKMPGPGENHFIIGMLKDKKHDAVFSILAGVADHWYLANLDSDRAATVHELSHSLSRYVAVEKIHRIETVALAIEQARTAAKPGDRIIITGSFVTVGAAMQTLNLV